jgi:hypothetical protein
MQNPDHPVKTLFNHSRLASLLSSAGLALLAISGLPTAAEAAITKVNAGISFNKLYEVYLSDTILTWTSAQDYATNTLAAKLVSIESAVENQFVSTLIRDSSLWVNSGSPARNYIGPYIGLRQLPGSSEPSGGWLWENGSPLTGFSNWFFNQPDNYNDDNVAVFYNGFQRASANTPWGDVYNGASISVGPGSPGANPFLANSFVVESPFPQASINEVASGTLNGIFYQVFNAGSPITWSGAQAYAQSMGTNLVSIRDAAQNTYISSLITDTSLWRNVGTGSAPNYIGPYIGLQQLPGSPEPGDGWIWEDGASIDGFKNWFFNQPDDLNADNVGVFYNGSVTAIANSTWGDVFDGLKILSGPGSPESNPFLATSFVVQSDLPMVPLGGPPFLGTLSTVPGPLPLMGALAAYRWSRRLRRSCTENAASKSHLPPTVSLSVHGRTS